LDNTARSSAAMPVGAIASLWAASTYPKPRQVAISAGLIRIFEHLGWATGVRWPDPGRLAAHRRGSTPDQPQPVLQTAETAAASAARDDLIDPA
jgi:hypothetical protein